MSVYPDSPNSPPQCPACGTTRTIRVKRRGLLQTLILHRFGLYPWECTGCRKIFNSKNRGKLKRRRRSNGEIHIPNSF